MSLTANPSETCGNGRDDDGDRLVDCAGDPDCATQAACTLPRRLTRAARARRRACTDGVDNDCDGKTDCADDDRHASDGTECCNGVDDNANGIVDDFACRCTGNGSCSADSSATRRHVLLQRAVHGFVGDVCPSWRPARRARRPPTRRQFRDVARSGPSPRR
ncbi:MAG: hypothetical protein U0235_00245 [Polyangiaceae bacterium]